MSRNYNLDFISDDKIFEQVRNALMPYDRSEGLNAVAPVNPRSSLFHSYSDDYLNMVASTLAHRICRFHQSLMCMIGGNWTDSRLGFDLQNIPESLFADMVACCKEMSATEIRRKFRRMHAIINENPKSICYVIDFSAPRTTDEPWNIAQGKSPLAFERIRRVSLQRFYEIVFGNRSVYQDLQIALPRIIDDVLNQYFPAC